jgi:hypothetical protein
MLKSRFDISLSRFNILWLIVGLVIGRAAGLFGGLNVNEWHFASTLSLVLWQIFSAVFAAIFLSFLMTSKAALNLKYGLLGLGAFFALAVYSGEIWSMVQPDPSPAWVTGMTTSEGIFYEWFVIHMSWIGGIAGIITGLVILKKQSALKSIQTPPPSEPETGDTSGEPKQG